MKWLREHTAEITVSAVAVLIGVAVYSYAHKDVGSLEESKRRGAVIVTALEAYHSGQGTYPDSLNALVPEYIDTIASPTWGLQRWSYRRYTAAEVGGSASDSSAVYFQLSVAENQNGYPVLYYDITARRWVLNN